MIETGTVISGTLRPEDLIPALLDELLAVNEAQGIEIASEYREVISAIEHDIPDWDRDTADYLAFEVLPDALDAALPETHYFGAHPGDSSDFGYWPIEFLEP